MTLLTVDALSKRYGGVTAVDDVSFTVAQGEIVGLMGANGAGKTTLFSMIAGNVRPSGGTIRFDGQRIDGLRPDEISRRGIARTFQIVRPFRRMSVLENVMVGRLYGGGERSVAAAERQARQVIDEVGLGGDVGRDAADLTLGALKRLEVARGLATNPRLLMLDEVLAGLTPTEVAGAIEMIRAIHLRRGLTIIIVEHVMRALMALSERVVVLHHGRRIAEGRPEEVASDPATIAAYLGEGAPR